MQSDYHREKQKEKHIIISSSSSSTSRNNGKPGNCNDAATVLFRIVVFFLPRSPTSVDSWAGAKLAFTHEPNKNTQSWVVQVQWLRPNIHFLFQEIFRKIRWCATHVECGIRPTTAAWQNTYCKYLIHSPCLRFVFNLVFFFFCNLFSRFNSTVFFISCFRLCVMFISKSRKLHTVNDPVTFFHSWNPRLVSIDDGRHFNWLDSSRCHHQYKVKGKTTST